MPFLDVLHAYFRAERLTGLLFLLPTGVALLGLAGVALRGERTAFGWGMAAPLLLVGLAFAAGGLALAVRTPPQVSALVAAYANDAASLLAVELPRMAKVNRNWPVIIGVWTTLALLGLSLRLGVKAEWAQGLGPALVLIGGMGFVIDGFAERRAVVYTAALERVAAVARE